MMVKEKHTDSSTSRSGITLQHVMDGVEDELVVIDSEYRVIFANSAVQSRLPTRRASPVGKLCYKVFHSRNKPCNVLLWPCLLREVLQVGKMATVVHHDNALGVDKYLKLTAYPLRDSYGNITAIVEVRRDVTAERALESQILRRHHQLLTLSHISSAVSGLWDLDAILRIALNNVLEIINGDIGGILLLDEQTETLYYRMQYGLSAKYVEGVRVHVGEGIGGRVAQTGEPILLEDISKDPRTAHPDLVSAEGLKGFVSIPLKAKDKVVGVMNIASHMVGRFGADDVSLLNSIGDYLGTAIEQARLYARLARARERYQMLLQEALTAQEEERKRIARELHDETSQSLTSLTLSLQAIMGMAEMKGIKDVELMEKLKSTHSYAVHAGYEVVRLMKELRPTLLDELGLPSAIHRYAKDNLQAQGINVSADFKGTDERLPSEVEVTLFRVAQGLIGNILEHSGAKNVLIKLECNDSECQLHIEDDGKGFDISKLTQVELSGRGTGLSTMRERLRFMGGTGHIESKPKQGTKVIAIVPLRSMGDEEDKSINSR
ncbi:GAF domain-containing protein [Chloroflexota bacterium]